MRVGSFGAVLAVLVSMFAPSAAHADDARLAFLSRMLKGSDQYRVRVQAALSIGEIGGRGASNALVEALRDDHPAVRTAAAAGLGRIGDAGSIQSLEALSRDSNGGVRSAARRSLRTLRAAAAAPSPPPDAPEEPATPSARARFYVGVGDMGSRAGTRDEELKGLLKRYVREALGRAGAVRVAPDGESPQASGRVIDRQHLEGYFLTGSVLKLRQTAPGTIRAEVSVMVLTNPGRDLRMMLNGAADISARSADDRSAQDQALQSAASSAVNRFVSTIGAH